MVRKAKARTRGTRKGGMYGPSYNPTLPHVQHNQGSFLGNLAGSVGNLGRNLRSNFGSYGHGYGGSKRRTKRRRGKAKKSKKRGKGKGKSRRRRH